MNNETHPPKYEGWLVSPSIVKRSFAVLGHSYLAMLLLYIPSSFSGCSLRDSGLSWDD